MTARYWIVLTAHLVPDDKDIRLFTANDLPHEACWQPIRHQFQWADGEGPLNLWNVRLTQKVLGGWMEWQEGRGELGWLYSRLTPRRVAGSIRRYKPNLTAMHLYIPL